jgi:hypothetical protein
MTEYFNKRRHPLLGNGTVNTLYVSVSEPPGPGINYTEPSSYKKEFTGPRSDKCSEPLLYVIKQVSHLKAMNKHVTIEEMLETVRSDPRLYNKSHTQ